MLDALTKILDCYIYRVGDQLSERGGGRGHGKGRGVGWGKLSTWLIHFYDCNEIRYLTRDFSTS